MREDEALYKAIVANPDDDTPRLVYADWLDENRPDKKPSPASGPSARAEFIRVQCRLGPMTSDEQGYLDLLNHYGDLARWLDTHAPEKRTVPGGLQSEDYRYTDYVRGFPHEAAAEYGEGRRDAVSKLCAALRTAGETTTVDSLRLYAYAGSQMAELLRDPAVAILRTLSLQPTDVVEIDDSVAEPAPTPTAGVAEEIARALAESPHLRNLRDLRLFFTLTDAAAEILAGAKTLDSLTDLSADFAGVSPAGLRALARADWFRNLRRLSFGERLRDPALVALADLPPLPILRKLDLSDNAFTATGLGRFAASKAFPNLVQLNLNRTPIGPAGTAALARGKWPLASLDLRVCNLGNAGAAALAGSRLLAGVKSSDLGTNDIGPKGMRALAGSPRVAAMRDLGLEYNPLGRGGLMALARSPHLRGLTALRLAHHRGDPPGYKVTDVGAFLAALDTPNLRYLMLPELPIGTSGARTIAASGMRLTRLDLEDGRIGDRGLAALVASPHLSGLIDARLSGNRLGAGAAALADRSVWPLLSQCWLSGNPIPRVIAKKLRRARRGVSVDTD